MLSLTESVLGDEFDSLVDVEIKKFQFIDGYDTLDLNVFQRHGVLFLKNEITEHTCYVHVSYIEDVANEKVTLLAVYQVKGTTIGVIKNEKLEKKLEECIKNFFFAGLI